MELIHIIANATFSSLRTNQITLSLENLASKQKLTRLLKSRRYAKATPLITRRRAITPAHVGNQCWFRMSSRHRARLGWQGGTVKLVEPAGIEPATFWLQTRRSPS
jgi:hypothetical protein